MPGLHLLGFSRAITATALDRALLIVHHLDNMLEARHARGTPQTPSLDLRPVSPIGWNHNVIFT